MSQNESKEPTLWNQRLKGIEKILGPSDNAVRHSPVPFAFGGDADVIMFSNHLKGCVYVTADLTGDADNGSADYELMICLPEHDDWGPQLICCLANYSLETKLAPHDSMNIGSMVEEDCRIKALVFWSYGSFELLGQTRELLLCLGITEKELEYKLEHGADKLIELLKKNNVYPLTDLVRNDIALVE